MGFRVMSVDKTTVEQVLEREVDESHLAIAKHELQGLDHGTIAEIFAVEESEIQDIVAEIEYKEVKRVVALELARFTADTDISWDSLELRALERLQKTVEISGDPEFHLKVAAMANKATRRHRGGATALNPAAAGARVSLSLTERFVEKLQTTAAGPAERVIERRVNLENAESLRASPKDVADFLKKPKEPKNQLEDALSNALDGMRIAV